MNQTAPSRASVIESREAVLLICAALLVGLFAITGVLTKAFHEKQSRLAQEWFSKGNDSLATGAPREALDDYRRALIFDPPNESYQLQLAQALAQLGRTAEARVYLLNLLAERPGAGEVNFELARLAAQSGTTSEAVRYYHAAIYGAWDSDPVAAQLRARLELSEFLVDHAENTQAEAELIALAANLSPNDTAQHAKVADLFARIGDARRAEEERQKSQPEENHIVRRGFTK